jgi:hypothetical protein
MKIAINKCYGGFGLSAAAYEQLIAWGVPVRRYIKQERDTDGLFLRQPANDGEVIFDRELSPQGEDSFSDLYWKYRNVQDRYWDCWTRENRTHPLVIRVIEELGEKANGQYAKLAVIEIPDDVAYEIDEYDGIEHIAETHRTWA